MKLLKFTLLFITLLFYSSFAQIKKNRNPHPFSGKVVFSSEFGFTHSYTDYLYSVPKLLSRGTIEFFLPVRSSNALGIKVFSGLGNLNSYGRNDEGKFINPNFNTNIFLLGTGFMYAGRFGYSIPYISANISHLRINPKDYQGKLLPFNAKRKYDLDLTMYTFEFGLRFLMEDFWSVNLGMNWNVTNSDFIDDLKMNEQKDKFITLFFGVSFYYSGSKYNDTDRDGVIDCKDACPGTLKGITVDEFGCPINAKSNKAKNPIEKIKKKKIDTVKVKKTDINKDSDKDGVPDYLDKCPDTPIATKVNSDGCKKVVKSQKIVTNKKSKFKKVKHAYQYSKEKALPGFFYTDGNLFCFQVAAFKSAKQAKNLKNKLNKSGHHPFIVKVINSKTGDVWFKVRIGYFKTLQSAKKYKKKYNF
jgi:cell division septation protein DedD